MPYQVAQHYDGWIVETAGRRIGPGYIYEQDAEDLAELLNDQEGRES